MSRRLTLDEMLWGEAPGDSQFAIAWAEDVSNVVLRLLWLGFDEVREKHLRVLDLPEMPEQPERGLVELHFHEIQLRWKQETDGYASIVPLHESPEFVNRSSASSKPPAYDLAFVHVSNRRWKWPVEAKVLTTEGAIAEYLKDVREKFIAGVAAPFVGEGGMIGYLVRGSADATLQKIGESLAQELKIVAEFAERPHRTSTHDRAKAPRLRLHHLIMHL